MKLHFQKFFFLISIVFSFLLLLFIFYKSEIYWDGIERDYYFKYYIISFVLIVFFSLGFFFNKKIQLYIIISSLSALVIFYSLEVYFTYSTNYDQYIDDYKKKIKIYNEKTGKKFDTRLKKKLINYFKNKKQKISLTIPPKTYFAKNLKLMPLAGISGIKTICCNESGNFAIHKTDRHGFNNPDLEWQNNYLDYILIGDSFVYGSAVNRPNDIASVLRKKYGKSVLNLGYPGNGPLLEYATLKEYYKKNTSNVIWFYFDNDIDDLNLELSSKILNKYYINENFSQKLKFRQNEIDNIIVKTIVEEERDRKKRAELYIDNPFVNFFKLYNLRKKIFPENKIKKYKKLEEILFMAKEFSLNNNSKFYFVYLPGYEIVENPYASLDSNIIKIIKKLEINFIDIKKEVFDKHKDPLTLFPFRMWGHYNEMGYEKIEDIKKLIEN